MIKKIIARLLLACLIPMNFAIAEFNIPLTNKNLGDEISRLSIKYKVDANAIRAIIKCESQLYGSALNENKDKNGNVWSRDWGYLQVNDYFHEKTMTNLGLSIRNQWDSLEYGVMLMAQQGFKPWSASAQCWLKKLQ